jgi:hypothetical protein
MFRRALQAAAAAALFMFVLQGSAFAEIGVPVLDDVTATVDATVEEVTGTVDEVVTEVTSELPAISPTDNSANDSKKSQGSSSSAEGHIVTTDLLDSDLLDISQTTSSTDANGCAADATVLALVGTKLMGTEADCSPGQSVSAETGYLTEVCEASGGAVCLALLYGKATTMDSPTSMFSSSDTAITSACLGGESMHPTDGCAGPVFLGVGRTHSDSTRSKDGRSAAANEWARLAELCLGGRDAVSGKCSGLGINLGHSEAHGSASPSGVDTSSESYILGIEAQGEDVIKVAPDALDLPADCYGTDPALCAALNQTVESTTGSSGAINQEGVSAELSGILDAGVDNAGVSVDVTKVKGVQVSPPKAPNVKPGPNNRPPAFAGPAGPALANTGANITATIGFALVLIGAGLGLASGRKHRHSEERGRS